jgi:hypothetical protein
MPSALMAFGANKRTVGEFPETVQRNMIAEAAPSATDKQLVLIGRPGTEVLAELGNGPCRGLQQKAGVFSGAALFLSAQELFLVSPSGGGGPVAGTVEGADRVRIASNAIAGISEARIATGSAIYFTDGVTVAAEDFPDGAGVTDVDYLKSFCFALRADTGQVYARGPGETEWDAINFTTAEAEPDPGVAIRALGDYLFVHGSETTEVFQLTGDANPAAAPVTGLRADVGCRSRDTVVRFDNSLVWVTNKCTVVRAETVPTVISDEGLSEEIRRNSAAGLRAWAFSADGHEYYVLTIGEAATYVYDAANKLWGRFDSKGFDFWRAHLGTDASGGALAGDTESGTVWRVAPDRQSDGDDEIVRVAAAFVPIPAGKAVCANFSVACAVGVAPLSGDGADPQIGMRYSDDQGKTWSSWRWRSLGVTGAYDQVVRWRNLGQMKPPGRMFQVRASDPVPVRFSDFRFNDV